MIFSCLLLIGLFEIMSSIIVDVIEENPKANLKEAWHLILSVIGCQLASSTIASILVMEENPRRKLERDDGIGIFFVCLSSQWYPVCPCTDHKPLSLRAW